MAKGTVKPEPSTPIIVALHDSQSDSDVKIAIDRASLKLRKEVTIKRRRNGTGASKPCILYATGEVNIGGHVVNVSVSMLTDHASAASMGVKMVAESAADASRQPGEVTTRPATFDELVAAGMIAQ
jgi:hypothetical protein